ncbi:MAG: YfhO family protein [Clostridia bacterium]
MILASFAFPALIMVLAFAATGIYPFGDNQIAVIDMYHQYVPFLGELQYKLQEGGSLFYTWNGAGGSNFWNLVAYYGASPLNLMLVLFPKKS